jgi:eukaryotic-like serine/threonine-protein kinase
MSLKAFLKSKLFVVNLVLIVFAFIVLTYAALSLLKSYTHHGRSLEVPDLTGLSIQEVELVVRENKLRFSVNDSVFAPDVIPGTMIVQYPAAGHKVKQRRTVYLTIASVMPEKVLMPKVVDVSLREAQSRLQNAGLRMGNVEYRPSEFLNLVLGQRLNGQAFPADTVLIKGTAIDLVVGKGLSNERTLAPNLFGLYLNDAKTQLYDLSLNVGALIYDQSVVNKSDSINARIWKQNPNSSSNNLIELGVSVDLWLTIDNEKLIVVDDDHTEFENQNESEDHSEDLDFN